MSLDSIGLDNKKEHLASTCELTTTTTTTNTSAAAAAAAYRPLVTSSITTSAAMTPGANHGHRFMVSLLTAETCAKLEPEDGEEL